MFQTHQRGARGVDLRRRGWRPPSRPEPYAENSVTSRCLPGHRGPAWARWPPRPQPQLSSASALPPHIPVPGERPSSIARSARKPPSPPVRQAKPASSISVGTSSANPCIHQRSHHLPRRCERYLRRARRMVVARRRQGQQSACGVRQLHRIVVHDRAPVSGPGDWTAATRPSSAARTRSKLRNMRPCLRSMCEPTRSPDAQIISSGE